MTHSARLILLTILLCAAPAVVGAACRHADLVVVAASSDINNPGANMASADIVVGKDGQIVVDRRAIAEPGKETP